MFLLRIALVGLFAVGFGHVEGRLVSASDLPAVSAQEAVLTVRVVGMDRDEGFVRIALFDRAETFTDEPMEAAVLVPSDGVAEWAVRVPYQVYAVAVVHDRDGNGKLNTNLLGMPREKYGFSSDARGTFGPPSFDDASFAVREPSVSVVVRVR
jgi:uncharacterized protein (DUF2141 family)